MYFELAEASQASVKNGKDVLAVAKPGSYAYKKELQLNTIRMGQKGYLLTEMIGNTLLCSTLISVAELHHFAPLNSFLLLSQH